MKISIYLMISVLLLVGSVSAQETIWLTKVRQIAPLESTQKDVGKLFGDPSERRSGSDEYKTEIGKFSFQYSEGKCGANDYAEYDVEKGVVTGISLSVKVNFKAAGLNLDGFRKEHVYSGVIFENDELGIHYRVSRGWLNYISISPRKSFKYFACPERPEEPRPVADDVDQETLSKLTQLKPIENNRADVVALFGEPSEVKEGAMDFYSGGKYSIAFVYSPGDCRYTGPVRYRIPKETIVRIAVFFNSNGVASTPDIERMVKLPAPDDGYSLYWDKSGGVDYKIEEGRVWRIQFEPSLKYAELNCAQ